MLHKADKLFHSSFDGDRMKQILENDNKSAPWRGIFNSWRHFHPIIFTPTQQNSTVDIGRRGGVMKQSGSLLENGTSKFGAQIQWHKKKYLLKTEGVKNSLYLKNIKFNMFVLIARPSVYTKIRYENTRTNNKTTEQQQQIKS